MQPPSSERSSAQAPSAQDLPYGPLPVRGEPAVTEAPERPPLEELVDLSWLSRGDAIPPEPAADGGDRGGAHGAGESSAPDPGARPEPASGEGEAASGADAQETSLSLTSPRPEADDDVHFDIAARALGVSRKTVERMVKRGNLERGPSNAPATVSKRGLVAALEARRRDVTHLTRATEIERSHPRDEHPAVASPEAAASVLTELAPVLAPLLDEFVEARSRAAVLEHELRRLRARAGQDRRRDELLLALATEGWWSRRKTRQAVLRQYVLGEHSEPGSSAG
jgi:hypothetical protein